MRQTCTNLVASVRQRLLNGARERGEEFQHMPTPVPLMPDGMARERGEEFQLTLIRYAKSLRRVLLNDIPTDHLCSKRLNEF